VYLGGPNEFLGHQTEPLLLEALDEIAHQVTLHVVLLGGDEGALEVGCGLGSWRAGHRCNALWKLCENEFLFHLKEGNPVIYNNMDEPGGHGAK
jgi:hypothetical protein